MKLDLKLHNGQRKTVSVLYISDMIQTVYSGWPSAECSIVARVPDGSFNEFSLSFESFLAVKKVFQNA